MSIYSVIGNIETGLLTAHGYNFVSTYGRTVGEDIERHDRNVQEINNDNLTTILNRKLNFSNIKNSDVKNIFINFGRLSKTIKYSEDDLHILYNMYISNLKSTGYLKGYNKVMGAIMAEFRNELAKQYAPEYATF